MESWSTNSSAIGSTSRSPEPPAGGLVLQGNSIEGTLPRSFYERETLQVARDLLGKLLVVRARVEEPLESPRAGITVGRIVETEGYHGADPAAHCSRGETPRCSIMFGEPGVAYVYFIYGMYEMLNFVTERAGYPGAVLIRALEPVAGEALMKKRRKVPRSQWTSGPGRLCRAMGIRMSHKGEPLTGPALYVVDDGFRPESVLKSPRAGLAVGTDVYWRYLMGGNPFVSKVPQNAKAVPADFAATRHRATRRGRA